MEGIFCRRHSLLVYLIGISCLCMVSVDFDDGDTCSVFSSDSMQTTSTHQDPDRSSKTVDELLQVMINVVQGNGDDAG